MRLDHVVVHTSNGLPFLQDLKASLEPLGFPFEPTKGKGAKGFKVSNIWIGQEYFEIVRILDPANHAWIPRWVERFKQGARGVFCLFIETQEIDALNQALQKRGVKTRGPERTSFKMLWGLFTVRMPWRYVVTLPLPGTDLEIGFIEYDAGAREKFKNYMTPNSEQNGIVGIESAEVMVPRLADSLDLLKNIFPTIGQQGEQWMVRLGAHTLWFSEAVTDDLHVRLHAAATDAARKDGRFQVENVEVVV